MPRLRAPLAPSCSPQATPAALHRAQREHHRCAPRSSAPRAVCGFLRLLGEPQALPSSRPPGPPMLWPRSIPDPPDSALPRGLCSPFPRSASDTAPAGRHVAAPPAAFPKPWGPCSHRPHVRVKCACGYLPAACLPAAPTSPGTAAREQWEHAGLRGVLATPGVRAKLRTARRELWAQPEKRPVAGSQT